MLFGELGKFAMPLISKNFSTQMLLQINMECLQNCLLWPERLQPGLQIIYCQILTCFFKKKYIKLCPGAIACRRRTRSSERRTERICIKKLQIKFLFLYSI